MKIALIPLLLTPFSAVNAQLGQPGILEIREKSAHYISKEQLNLPTEASRIRTMNQVNGFESIQVNVDASGNNITGDAANEPSIAVNPLNPNQIAIGWRQFNTNTNSFRMAGRSYSDDGGKVWNFQEVFESGVFRSDPVLAANADGQFYYQSLKVEFDSQGNATVFTVDQWTSFDGGITWVDKTFAYGGDKSWIAIDQTDGTTRGNIYAAWNVAGNAYFPATYNKSLDNGLSFTQPTILPRSPIFGTVDVDMNGSFYVFGIDAMSPGGTLADLFLLKSSNPEVNSPLFPTITPVNLGGPSRIGSFINPQGLNGQLYVKVDKSNRQSRNNVYVLGSIDPEGSDPLDVHFARSVDGGESFSTFTRINTDDSISWQWFGTMAVAPNGRIDVIWNDSRNDENNTNTNNGSSRLFYSYSHDAGVTFSKEQAVSPLFNQAIGYPVQRKMGDYIDMVSTNLGAHIIYTATFNGEQDIYYMHAKPSAIEENPDFASLLTNNAWVVEGVPSQGILSSTLINNGQPDKPLKSFEALFTAQPDGTPMWLVAQGDIPLQGDSYDMPVFMPTGDLTQNSQPLYAIGMLTKNRLRDANNELIDNKIEYLFNMTDSVKTELQKLVGNQYNEAFFDSNPFNGISKTLIFDSLLPRDQQRSDLCSIHGQVLTSAGENSEGRVQFTFKRNNVLNVFAADFTYKKKVNDKGIAEIVLNEAGLAQPFWEVIQSTDKGILSDGSVQNNVSKPIGGLGFFEKGDETGVNNTGTEQVSVKGAQITTIKPDGSTEIMSRLANNAYCGELLE